LGDPILKSPSQKWAGRVVQVKALSSNLSTTKKERWQYERLILNYRGNRQRMDTENPTYI
jgi:hypothetical protein